MIKCALVLSGQPKFFDIAYPQIKRNIIDQNNCDVFFHTWWSADSVGKTYEGVSWSNDFKEEVKNDTPRKLIQLYNPKYFLIEPQKMDIFPDNKTKEDYPPTQGENIAFQNFSMFYSMMKAIDLCAAYERAFHFKYDVVIRCRFDAAPMDPLDVERYEITSNTKEIQYANTCRNPNVISDWLFWSNSDNMLRLCWAYLLIDRYVSHDGVMLCGEELLTHHINTLRYTRCPKPISLFLVRDKYFKNRQFGRAW